MYCISPIFVFPSLALSNEVITAQQENLWVFLQPFSLPDSQRYRTCPRELAVDLLLEVGAELDLDLVPRGTPPMVAWDYNIETVGLGEGGGGGKEFGDGGSDGTVPLGAVGGGGIRFCKAAHNTQAKYTS